MTPDEIGIGARMYLGELSSGRNNNLNLIRMVAATGVLVSHAWPIALGPGTVEPLQTLTGVTLGHICVYVFFAISGFLITGSFENARSLTDFLAARALRLFPALVVSLLLVALVLGPAVTQLPATAYLGDSETWTFLVRNTLLAFPQYTLPGVFVDNPYPTVEGSIWTLIHEVACYAGVFVLGVAGLFSRPRAATALLVAYLVLSFSLLELDAVPHPRIASFLGLSNLFVVGMVFYLWRNRIPLSFPIAIALVASAAVLRDTPVYAPVLALALTYVTFWAGYVPGGILRAYNRLGDYSYGLYIYAFPMQGLAVWLAGPMGPVENIAWALPMTLLPSVLSWHLLERPALRSRAAIAARINQAVHRAA